MDSSEDVAIDVCLLLDVIILARNIANDIVKLVKDISVDNGTDTSFYNTNVIKEIMYCTKSSSEVATVALNDVITDIINYPQDIIDALNFDPESEKERIEKGGKTKTIFSNAVSSYIDNNSFISLVIHGDAYDGLEGDAALKKLMSNLTILQKNTTKSSIMKTSCNRILMERVRKTM